MGYTRDFEISVDSLKSMAAFAPEQWIGIPYDLPGVGKKGVALCANNTEFVDLKFDMYSFNPWPSSPETSTRVGL